MNEIKKDEEFLKMKEIYNTCLLNNQMYFYSITGSLISIPLGIYFKTYKPLALSIFIGTGLDFYYGRKKCNKIKNEIDEYLINKKKKELLN